MSVSNNGPVVTKPKSGGEQLSVLRSEKDDLAVPPFVEVASSRILSAQINVFLQTPAETMIYKRL